MRDSPATSHGHVLRIHWHPTSPHQTPQPIPYFIKVGRFMDEAYGDACRRGTGLLVASSLADGIQWRRPKSCPIKKLSQNGLI